MARTFLLGLLASAPAVVIWLVTATFGLGGSNGVLAIGVLRPRPGSRARDKSPLAQIRGVHHRARFLESSRCSPVLPAGSDCHRDRVVDGGVSAHGWTPSAVGDDSGAGTFRRCAVPSTTSAWYVFTEYPTTLLRPGGVIGAFIVAVIVELIFEHETGVPTPETMAADQPSATEPGQTTSRQQ